MFVVIVIGFIVGFVFFLLLWGGVVLGLVFWFEGIEIVMFVMLMLGVIVMFYVVYMYFFLVCDCYGIDDRLKWIIMLL